MAEHIEDLHIWVTVAKNAILKKIDSGEIPNNPDSIKNAATQLAMDMKDKMEGITPEMLASEVENKIMMHRLTKNAHISGF